MEELRAHVRKYGPVMQRYYVQYLSGFDAVVLNELVQVRPSVSLVMNLWQLIFYIVEVNSVAVFALVHINNPLVLNVFAELVCVS